MDNSEINLFTDTVPMYSSLNSGGLYANGLSGEKLRPNFRKQVPSLMGVMHIIPDSTSRGMVTSETTPLWELLVLKMETEGQ